MIAQELTRADVQKIIHRLKKDKAIRLSLDEFGEILDFQSAAGYKLIQTCGIADGFEMAFENDAVKTVECAGNLIDNFVGISWHPFLVIY